MQMKMFLLIMAFPVISTLCSARTSNHPDKGKKYPSSYKEGIIVNGNSSEWETSLFNFNKQAQVNYSIVNDTSAFYICVRIADEPAQMKVLRNGMEILFNSKGKKKAEATLHYPIGGKTDMGGKMHPSDNRSRKTMQLMFLLQMQDMELTGFKDGINGFQSIKSGKHGFLAAVNWDSTNVMVYEARIPFSAFVTDMKAAIPLAVGIIIKGAPRPHQEGGEGGSQDQGQGGMQGRQGQGGSGGMNHGGMGREGSMQGSGDNMKMFEDDEIWQSIVVAKKE
jgi:hypothetical protein